MSDETKINCAKPYTNKDKWIISIVAGMLFMLISSPFLYDNFGQILTFIKTTNFYGVPTLEGLILHSLIFTVVIRILIR